MKDNHAIGMHALIIHILIAMARQESFTCLSPTNALRITPHLVRKSVRYEKELVFL